MMRAPGQSTRGADAASEIKELKRQIGILNRRTTVPPKVKPAGPGVPLGATRAEATIIGRAGRTETTGWAFTPLSRPGSQPPALVESTFGHFSVRDSGWYSIKAHVGMGWSSPPPRVWIFVNPATTSAMGDSHQFTQSVALAGGDLGQGLAFGPVWLYGDGQDASMSGVGLLGLDVEWGGGGSAPDWVEAWIDVIRVG